MRALVQSGSERYSKLPEVPTIYELMDSYKTPDATKRLAKVMLSSGDLGRPFIAPPGMAIERVRGLRDGFMKTMTDPILLSEAAKRKWEVVPLRGEELESLAREVIVQPPEVIERMRRLLGK